MSRQGLNMRWLVVGAFVIGLVLAVLPAAAQVGEAPPSVAVLDRALLINEVQFEPDFRTVRRQPGVLVLEVDGSLRRLVEGPAEWASWSPDGARVGYFQPLEGEIRVVDRDGGGERLLLDQALPAAQPWSPDGTALLATAFATDGSSALVVVDVDTGATSAVPGIPEQFSMPAWSPDGSAIAYASPEGVQVVPRNGGTAHTLIGGVGLIGRPAWSPDGAEIAVLASTTPEYSATRRLVVAAADGSGQRTVGGLAASGEDVTWSPDGALIAYNGCDPMDCTTQLVATADPSGGVPEVLHAERIALDWAGDRSLLVQRQDGTLAALDVTDGSTVAISVPLSFVIGAARDPGPARPPLTATVARALGWSRQRPVGGATTALLGRADDFADALASGGAQGALDAPLLLTPGDRLDPAVLGELDRLGATDVVLLGGTAALSADVEAALEAAGRTVRRVQGPTRIHTAVALAKATLPEPTRIILVRAFGDEMDPTRGFADALAAGAAAAGLTAPLLLTDTAGLSDPVAAYLDRTPSVTEVVVIGGTTAVDDAVLETLEARDLAVTRIAGPERIATAAAVARFALEADVGDDTPPPTGGTYAIVDGTDPLAWADGFAGAGLTDVTAGGGVLLVDSMAVAQPTAGVLARAVQGAALTCASLVQQRICNDVTGIRATAEPQAAATARLTDGDVVADVRAQEAGETICLLATMEGAAMAGVGFGSGPVSDIGLIAPGDDGAAVRCVRASFNRLTVDTVSDVVVITTDGRELRGRLTTR